MKTKKIEKTVTKAGVIMLCLMTLIGILGVFDMVCNLDIFPTAAGKNAFTIFSLILCVLVLSCVMVATMLNIPRIANSIEELAERYTTL